MAQLLIPLIVREERLVIFIPPPFVFVSRLLLTVDYLTLTW